MWFCMVSQIRSLINLQDWILWLKFLADVCFTSLLALGQADSEDEVDGDDDDDDEEDDDDENEEDLTLEHFMDGQVRHWENN